MKLKNFLQLMLLLCVQQLTALTCNTDKSYLFEDIPSIFPSRINPPGLNSPDKLWWTKEITPDFHVCGRLSRYDMKQAVDAGFKSILSLFTYPEGDPEGDFGGDSLPTTETERRIVEDTLNLQFYSVLEPLDEWSSVEAVEKLTAIIPHLKKPALLRCDRGYTIAFVTMLYLANQTRYDVNFRPQVTSKKFYEIAYSMGLDFLSRIPMEVVSEVTGEPSPNEELMKILSPKYEPEDWLDYWFAHPVYKNWFIAGQITKTHLSPLKEFGYVSVINLRLGVTHGGVPSQEEVNLLNILSNTGTYGDDNTLPRQHGDRLRSTRIDFERKNGFISNNSVVNYESRNTREFGDDVGYNEQLERDLVEDAGLLYFHLPLKSKDDLGKFFKKNHVRLMEISQKGPVLVHCSDGSRAAFVSVLAASLQYGMTLDWSLQRLKEMGFGVASDRNPSVFEVYHDLLMQHSTKDSMHVEL